MLLSVWVFRDKKRTARKKRSWFFCQSLGAHGFYIPQRVFNNLTYELMYVSTGFFRVSIGIDSCKELKTCSAEFS
ncbi:unnamed protein product [Acanthoscelides obtectus]|uniref:Uncharacterized protein n=1 Tax=Acanthoscelides obtectus TaxID=200917 RepID=A0A9P0LG59_ACAOB|nr:unnamed protein product [Acanthoscelides obtectus]CAK1664646.1 hypothetical protein AOBTE_LOCUS24385 [Acanthoscelides obtectus]